MDSKSTASVTQFSYASSGVDINKADATKQEMKAVLAQKETRVMNSLGAFASLFDIHYPELEHPVLVLKMEEPGSKQLLAAQHGRLPDIAYDLVNHLINDTVVMGAKPLAILDTIVCGELEKEVILDLVRFMKLACEAQGCSLVGGETSEQPRVLPRGSYILSAACAGIVDKKKIIDGSGIQAGHKVLAVASSGVHTNGYTLIRSLLDAKPELASEQVDGKSFIEQVLVPHRCYNLPLQKLFSGARPSGLAHITGGGIVDNSKRILPSHIDLEIDFSAIEVPAIFTSIQRAGNVDDADMLRTYNMGVGLVVVCAPEIVQHVIDVFGEYEQKCYVIGEARDGEGNVKV